MKPQLPSPLSILIIEDVEEMRSLLAYVLQSIPHVKVSGLAKNSFEARLELTRRRPDLVFLDEVLPGESSRDVLTDLISQRIPVILMSSLEEPQESNLGGAGARIAKPGWSSLDADRIRIEKVIFDQFSRSDA